MVFTAFTDGNGEIPHIQHNFVTGHLPNNILRLFIIQGAFSMAIAILAAFTLPDSPLKTRWLKQEERELAHARIARDTTGRREGTSVWTGLREAASDWRTWVFCLMDNFHLSVCGSYSSGVKNL